jgi:magnesium-transporting ATPase (P-type)
MASTANQNGISLLSNGSSDEFRPRILQRPSPKVTILKRPPDSSNSQSSNSQQNVNKTQIKSLEQREKEYAEARLRILGSATESSVSEDQVQSR